MKRIRPRTTTNARTLRHNPTEAEKRLWRAIRQNQLGHRFRRQHPVGPYIADFACVEAALILEVDGGQHCDNPHDVVRDADLKAHGFHILRFWNNEVLDNLEGVLQTIVQFLDGEAS